MVARLERLDDVHRATMLGGHDGRPVYGGLDEGQAKRLLQRDVDEHARRPLREAVDVADVLLHVMRRVGLQQPVASAPG